MKINIDEILEEIRNIPDSRIKQIDKEFTEIVNKAEPEEFIFELPKSKQNFNREIENNYVIQNKDDKNEIIYNKENTVKITSTLNSDNLVYAAA